MLGMIPGMAQVPEEMLGQFDEGQLVRYEAAIDSMTPSERMDPVVLDGQRRARVARGAGTSVSVVNELLKSFKLMRRQMKDLKSKGVLGRLAGRQMDKQKLKQLEEMRRKGVDLSRWFPES
jgi:signal recognition particle subunit SRP54